MFPQSILVVSFNEPKKVTIRIWTVIYFISFFLFKNCPKILSIFNILPKKNLRKVIVKAQQYMYMKYVTHECLSHRRQFMDETASRFKLQTFRVERNNTIGKYV